MSTPPPNYRYRVEVVRVIDADTLECDIDLGFFARLRVRLRLLGVNAPEVSTPEGKAAKRWVEALLAGTPGPLAADTVKADKYGGRWDAKVWLTGTLTLNDALLAAGHAVPFMVPAK